MAFMSQEHKKRIATLLKDVIPKSWKWTLAVDNHSTIVLNIQAAPVDLIAMNNLIASDYEHRTGNFVNHAKDYIQVNHYHLHNHFDGKTLKLFKKINDALNLDNWDKSDISTDYFNCGHYVRINVGRWNKPFRVLA